MEDIELLSYLLVFALSMIFSLFAVEGYSKRRESIIQGSVFSFAAMMTWGVLSACHLSLAYASDFIILSWIYVVLAFIFCLSGFALLFLSFKQAKDEWSV